MRVKFQADADLDARVVRGLKRRLPEIDVRAAVDAGLAGLHDSKVLQIAAQSGRVLVSQDRRTMPRHFRLFMTECSSPGVVLLRGGISIAAAVEELALIWSASEAEDWIDRLIWIPL